MLANVATGLALMTYDCKPGEDSSVGEIHHWIVSEIVRLLKHRGSDVNPKFCTQIALYYTSLSIQPQFADLTASLEEALDAIDPKNFEMPVFYQKDMALAAKAQCQRASNQHRKYTVEPLLSHLKYKAFPVQLSIFKQEKDQEKELIGVFLSNAGAYHERRSFQMMTNVYGHFFPNVAIYAAPVHNNAAFTKQFRELIANSVPK